MTKNDILRKGGIAAGAIITLGALSSAFLAYGDSVTSDPTEVLREPYCLTLTQNTDGSLAGAGYVGEAFYTDNDNVRHSRGKYGVDLTIENVQVDVLDENGNVIGTRGEDQITSLTLRAMSVGDDPENIYLPNCISFDYNGQTLTSDIYNVEFNYYTPEQGNTEYNSFVDSPELKHVYVGPSAKNVTWNGEDFLKMRNFHFRSASVPDFHFNNGSNGTINIYVPEVLFDYYADVINGASYTTTVWSEDPLSPTYVNVDVPGTLADAISSNIDNLNEVRWLVVTGSPNELDLRMMRRLPRLEILDLSAATGLTTIVGCNGLKYLREVHFPKEIINIGEEAFRDCTALEELEIPESVQDIKDYAFYGSSIRKINLENVLTFGYQSFAYNKLESINLENTKSTSGYTFAYNSNLTDVNFGAIEYIGYDTFYCCDIRKLVVPNSCIKIESYAFGWNYNLREIEIGSGLESISRNAFDGCTIEKFTIRTLFPTSQCGCNENADLSNATLYVPALTLNEYLLADGWAVFKNVKPLDEELTDITIDRTFMLTSDKGIAKDAALRVQYGTWYDNNDYSQSGYGHLTVRRNINAPLNLGKYYQQGNKSLNEWWDNNGYQYRSYYNGSTLIPYSEMTAKDIELKLTLRTDRWHFISLPFDVNVSDIKTTDEALWVVRKYSGADRAALNENTWQNMIDGSVLQAGEGYIFHCAHDNTSEVEFTFKPASVESGNRLFAKDAVAKELAEYKSEFEHNASWNLVGNTYPAYLNIHALGFEAPVTLYNGNTYIAYSPVDDDLVLEPFQAFFVQRQDTEGGDAITLNPEGRAHTEEEAAALEIEWKKAPARYSTAARSLFNVHISGESGSDRARVVINDEALMGYEKNRDASKFMSGEKDVPQIFVVNDHRRMAIDERPLADGEIALGTYFGKSGEYTISLDTRNAGDYTVLLVDHKTGTTTDLTSGDYTFRTDAATEEGRFSLLLKAQSTAADSLEPESVKVSVDGDTLSVSAPEEIEITVIAADGKTVAAGRSASFSATLATGVYAVKAGNVTAKVMVGK